MVAATGDGRFFASQASSSHSIARDQETANSTPRSRLAPTIRPIDPTAIDEPILAAVVADPASGRTLETWTTEPGVQFYTGNFLDGTLIGKAGKPYPKWSAFCLETQHFPDSPNHPDFPSIELRPEMAYLSQTVFAFGAR